MIKRSCS